MVENIDLTLILRNTERASRDAAAAFEATERLVVGVGSRFDALESRISSLERRVSVLEAGLDGIARSNHRIEQALSEIMARLPG